MPNQGVGSTVDVERSLRAAADGGAQAAAERFVAEKLIDGSGQGSDPEMMVRFSEDGGRTWGNQRIAGMGKLGNYGTRVRLTRCGMFRERSVRIAVSDPVKAVVVGAWMDREVLAA